jgi:uncharacterized protein YbjT (DUF2867 family)
MYIVMGATGNVGGAVAEALIAGGEKVAVLTRRPDDAVGWRRKGALVLKADVHDITSLKTAFRQGRRAFLLNPPADPSGDSDSAERETIANILEALVDSGLEKVVAASTYGARQDEPAGDLTTLWQLEEGLRRQEIPAAINRGAYYMTNWTGLVGAVKETGRLPSLFPASVEIPMVAPHDLGKAAAARLRSPVNDIGVCYVEGPERYTPRQVADALGQVLGRDVELDVVPREDWESFFADIGFSEAAVRSYTRMTAISVDENFDTPEAPCRGQTSLAAFMASALHGANRTS